MSAGARQVLFLAVAIAFLGPSALADEAKTRGSSSGGSSSSSAGARHHSGSSGSSSSGTYSRSDSSGSSHSYGSGSSSASRSDLTGAQRRHPRAGTGTGWRYPYGGYYGRGYYGGYYGYPYYGYGYYPYYGYSPYWAWGYGYYPYGGLYFDASWWSPPYYGHGAYVSSSADTGSVRILVDQPKARVYVDGYYAGTVDDFDGMFQRLYIEPGQHDITIKLEGYKTHNFLAYVPQEGTLKLRWEMERGEGHDGSGDPTLAPPKREARYETSPEDRDGERVRERDAERDRSERDRDVSVSRSTQDEPRASQGSIRFEVQPSDASIYVDGSFRGTGRDLRALDLAAGPHRVEIVRPGFRTYERDVVVDPAASVDLSVELEK